MNTDTKYLTSSFIISSIENINDHESKIIALIKYKTPEYKSRANARDVIHEMISLTIPRRLLNVDDDFKFTYLLAELAFNDISASLSRRSTAFADKDNEHKFKDVFNLIGRAIGPSWWIMREEHRTEEEPTPEEMDSYYMFRGMPDGYSTRDVRNRQEEQSKHDRTIEWLRKNGLLYKASEFGLV